MNRQQLDAIAQAVRYRVQNLWSSAEADMSDAQLLGRRQGQVEATLAAVATILTFADPPPDEWEGYG